MILKNIRVYVFESDLAVIRRQPVSEFPGFVGNTATNLPYLSGWRWLAGEITWTDTNNLEVLKMHKFGLDVLWKDAVANRSKTGEITIGFSIVAGPAFREKYGLGKSSLSEPLFTNGGVQFLVTGCIGIGVPDLAILPATVNDSTLDPGQTVTLQVGIKNVGFGTCEPSTIRYYLSPNSTITPADTFVGSGPVGSLDTDQETVGEIEVTAPIEPGLYYLGACIDEVFDEQNLGNNCSFTGVQVKVGDCDLLTVESTTVGTMQTFQACRQLTLGPSLDIATDLGASFYTGKTVCFENGVSILENARLTVGTCGHDICIQRIGPLESGCMPCVTLVCDFEPDCCAGNWDASCVQKVGTLCNLPCV